MAHKPFFVLWTIEGEEPSSFTVHSLRYGWHEQWPFHSSEEDAFLAFKTANHLAPESLKHKVVHFFTLDWWDESYISEGVQETSKLVWLIVLRLLKMSPLMVMCPNSTGCVISSILMSNRSCFSATACFTRSHTMGEKLEHWKEVVT